MISMSVRPSEDGLVRACPALRIWRARPATVPTAIGSGPLGSRKAIAPCSFLVLRREGLSPGNRQPRVFKERSPKGRSSVYRLSCVGSRSSAFIPRRKGVGFRLGFCNYARFVRPGMVRVQCQVESEQSHEDGVLASAYKGTSGGLVVILVNLSRNDVACDLGTPRRVDVYTTSSRSNLERSRQDATGIKPPARAASTCVLR